VEKAKWVSLATAHEVNDLDLVGVFNDSVRPKRFADNVLIDLDRDTLERQFEVFEEFIKRKFTGYLTPLTI
jgi:hypothetical protein